MQPAPVNPDPDGVPEAPGSDGTPKPVDMTPVPGLGDRLKRRIRRDFREAMIDPSERPTGDFDMSWTSSLSQRSRPGGRLLQPHHRHAPGHGRHLPAARHEQGDLDLTLRVWTAVIVAYAVFRAFRPVRYYDDLRSLLRVIGEVGAPRPGVIFTGGWDSPLVFTLLTPMALAGFARGFGFGLRIAVAAVLAVSLARSSPTPATAARSVLQSASWAVDRAHRGGHRRVRPADLR